MGRKTPERLKFMELVAEALEKKSTKHPSQWNASQIRAFNERLYDLIEQEYHENKSSKTASTYGIQFTKSRAKYDIVLTEESFRSHFCKKRTGDFRNYTCNRYALYLGVKVNDQLIKTWEKYMALAVGGRTMNTVISDWETRVRQIYTRQQSFLTIPLIGGTVLGVDALPMATYFADVSYTPLNTLHTKEVLLEKEKQQINRFRLHKKALQNDQLLTQKNLEDYKRILILGNPGTGKTVYAKWLCHQWAEGRLNVNGIPIYIELREVNFESETPIFDYLKQWLERCLQVTIGQSFLHKEMLAQFFWVLDGFDEIDFDQQERLLELIITVNKDAHFMLLSRPYAMLGYESIAGVDTIVELLGFGQNSQQLYTKKVLQSIGKGQSISAFWKLVDMHPFLRELTATPLTLSYLLVLFCKKRREEGSQLLNIDSSYQLHREVLYSIRQHFLQKVSTQKLKMEWETTFDLALVEGGKLAYSMERKRLYAINNDNPAVSYTGGYRMLRELSHIGVGRLEFIACEKQREIQGEESRTSRFSFVTTTIQEYLAACHFTELVHKNKIKYFLHAFSKHTNWNFCQMVIGKYVADKEECFIHELNKVLVYNWEQQKNVHNMYRYLMFLGELDANSLKRLISYELMEQFWDTIIKTMIERSVWQKLIGDAWNKILIKASFSIQRKMMDLYTQTSAESFMPLFREQQLDTVAYERICVVVKLTSQTILAQQRWFVEHAIAALIQLNKVLLDNVGKDKRFIVLVELYFDVLMGSKPEDYAYLSAVVCEKLFQQKWDPILKSKLLTWLGQRDETDYQYNQDILLNQIKEQNINIESIQLTLEKLIWKFPAYFDVNSYVPTTALETTHDLVEDLMALLNLDRQHSEEGSQEKLTILQSAVILLNYFPCVNNYQLIFDLINEYLLDDDCSCFDIAYTASLDCFIQQYLNEYTNGSSVEDQILTLSYLLKGLYHIEGGTVIYTKYRCFFYETLETIVTIEWEYLAHKLENSMQKEVDSYLYYYNLIIRRTDFLDAKFLIDQLMQSRIFHHTIIQQSFLLPLFFNAVPIHQTAYWNYFDYLWKSTSNDQQWLEILTKASVYSFRKNIEPLASAWRQLSSYWATNDSTIDATIFLPIVKVLTFIEKNELMNYPSASQIITIIDTILDNDALQLCVLEKERTIQQPAILAYLLLLRFCHNAVNPYLREAVKKTTCDCQYLWGYMIDLFDLIDLEFFKYYLPYDTYQSLKAFYEAYAPCDCALVLE